MMRFKNNAGFSIIEAMMAITIIGMVLAPIFILETNVFTAVGRLAEGFHRIILSKQFMFVAYKQQTPESKEFKFEKREENPIAMMRYTFTPIDKQSSLAQLTGMYRKQVITSGFEKTSPEGMAVQFVYQPERPQS
jgi:hypothetical protein